MQIICLKKSICRLRELLRQIDYQGGGSISRIVPNVQKYYNNTSKSPYLFSYRILIAIIKQIFL